MLFIFQHLYLITNIYNSKRENLKEVNMKIIPIDEQNPRTNPEVLMEGELYQTWLLQELSVCMDT